MSASNRSNPRAISYFHTRYLTFNLFPSHSPPTTQILRDYRLPSLQMALQIHHLRPPIPPAPASSVGSLSSWPTKQSTIAGDLHRSFASVKMISSKTRKNKGFRFSVRVRSSLETSGTPVVVGQVTEVDKDSFWPIVNAAGDKTVVLDMYTQWFPVRVRSSLETSGTPVVVGQVTEVDKDSFWPIVNAAGDKTVVLDNAIVYPKIFCF